MTYQHIQVPSDGARITVNDDSSLNVPDNPIIPFVEGDGTGVDITPVMRKVVDAAVSKSYGGTRRLVWMEIYAGEKAVNLYGGDNWRDYVEQALERFGFRQRPAMLVVMLSLFALHTVEVSLYAVAIRILAGIEGAPAIAGELARDWSDYLYFSFTSYSSLGIGDVYPRGGVRLLTGIEALNGLMMIAWSASYSYLIMERLWGFPGGHGGQHRGDTRD